MTFTQVYTHALYHRTPAGFNFTSAGAIAPMEDTIAPLQEAIAPLQNAIQPLQEANQTPARVHRTNVCHGGSSPDLPLVHSVYLTCILCTHY